MSIGKDSWVRRSIIGGGPITVITDYDIVKVECLLIHRQIAKIEASFMLVFEGSSLGMHGLVPNSERQSDGPSTSFQLS
ncbi:hypothetical protein SUGI_0370780 [Cryptomeria japonica]|nr:hypothetical protein SUGI_0370780 [Cryptomeria japonica]